REIARYVEEEVKKWPRFTVRDYIRPAKACLVYDMASRPPLFDTIVFPFFQRRIRRNGVPQAVEHLRLESENLQPSLVSQPAFAAFAEWNRKLVKIEGWLRHRREIAGIYRRQLSKYMVSAETAESVLEGSCFVNFPLVVPEEKRNHICR